MQLIATQAFPYGNKALKPGDRFEASDEDARLLKGFGKARDGATVAEKTAAEVVPEVPRKKRTYKRRDMQAEQTSLIGDKE